MKLYDEYDPWPGDKQCKAISVMSEDQVFALTISYEYIPEKSHIWAYIWIEIINGERNSMRLIENYGTDEFKIDFRKKMYKWFRSQCYKYNLSWYTSKKMMLLAAKALERVFKK